MTVYERIYLQVRKIPRGWVATYGDIGRAVGAHPRVVGNALHANPNEHEIPCHRVVNAAGRLSGAFAFGGSGEQRHRLEQEGVAIRDDRIDLAQYRFLFNSPPETATIASAAGVAQW